MKYLNERFLSRLLFAAGGLALAFACVTHRRDLQDTEPQEWWEGHGPVVPHDSFPADCSLCHESEGWSTIRADFSFDHEAETGVALEGAHAAAECLRCHNDRGPVATFAARGCSGCHEDIHRGELGRDCEACHTQNDWKPDQHVAGHEGTRFPLVGAHASLACWRCHEGADTGDFTGEDPQCASCHAKDYAATTNPDHTAAGFPMTCDKCHIPTLWSGAAFKHPGFALRGGHAGLDCNDCHTSPTFSQQSTQCVSCHLDDYQATTNPSHTGSSFPTTCEVCHNISSWQGATFNHTSWPLTGAHKNAGCNDCHTGGVYTGTPTDCYSCHATEYQNTTNPDHQASGFPTTCENCHTTSMWEGATFNHSTWPLTGAHMTAGCNECHIGGVYAGTPTDCFSCHAAEYQNTTNPDHQASGFPITCEVCHTTSMWQGATFSHPQFPINSGKHKNLDCADCHTTPGNFMTFSCIDCHEHNQTKMDDKHKDVTGYVWASNACYSCHPDGKE